MKKRIWILAAIVLVLILPAWTCYRFLHDDPPPEDDDLRVQREEIPEAENAYPCFCLAAESLQWPEEKQKKERLDAVLDGQEWDAEFVAELLEANEEALADLEHGLALPHCQGPEINSINDAITAPVSAWRKLVKLLCLRARRLSEEGRRDEALQQAMKAVRFGHMIEGYKGGLIDYLVGCACKQIGLQQMRALSTEDGAPAPVLVECARDLMEYPPNVRGLQDALKVEYAILRKVVDDTAAGKLGLNLPPSQASAWRGVSKPLFKPNRTKAIFAEILRTWVENIPRTYAQRATPDVPGWVLKLEEETPSKLELLSSGNAIGRALVFMLMPGYSGTVKCREDVQVAATRLVLALKAYEIENGALPASLDELVPDCLDAVPPDDFDGEPVRYDAERGVIYSVGEDLEDDGGSDGDIAWALSDPARSIEEREM